MGRRFDLSNGNGRLDAIEEMVEQYGEEEFFKGLARFLSSRECESLCDFFGIELREDTEEEEEEEEEEEDED